MENDPAKWKFPLAKKLLAQGRDEGRAEGRDEGRAEGRDEGRAEGRNEGRAEGWAQAKGEDVLQVLAARGIPVPVSTADRIRASRDLNELDRWLRRAVAIARANEIFGG